MTRSEALDLGYSPDGPDDFEIGDEVERYRGLTCRIHWPNPDETEAEVEVLGWYGELIEPTPDEAFCLLQSWLERGLP